MEWVTMIEDILKDIVNTEELPENGLFLQANTGRSGDKIVSYSVCIFEPDYPLGNEKQIPTSNALVMNIREKKSRLEMMVSHVQADDIELPMDAEKKRTPSATYTSIIMDKDSVNLEDYIKRNCDYVLSRYVSKASSFACCSKFIECSNAKKCVHENKLYSKACQYRMNLEAGRIFYGKNRNVE